MLISSDEIERTLERRMVKTLLWCSWEAATQTWRKCFRLIIKKSEDHCDWRVPLDIA